MATKRKAAGQDSEAKQPLWLQVTEEQDGSGGWRSFYHLTVKVCTQKYDTGGHGWVPTGVDDGYRSGYLFTGLRLQAQGDDDSRKRELGQAVYGWNDGGAVEYHDVFSIDRTKAGRMAKTLDMVAKRLELIYQVRGSARTFGQMVGRLAEVLGCEGIVTQAKSRYSCEPWRWQAVGDGVYTVDRLVAEWQEGAEKPAPLQLPAAGETTDTEVVS